MLIKRNLEAAGVDFILGRYNVPRNGVLIVHSAFRGLSRTGYRAENFIEALHEYMSFGTILMPTMTWRTVTTANPFFDEIATPSHTGILSEIFRVRYSSARSLHPTHSVAGLGPDAERLLSRHHIDNTPCSINSPYGIAQGFDTHILLLGIGLESCTAIHHVEEVVAPELYLRPSEESEVYTCRDRKGNDVMVQLRRHLRLKRNFEQFGPKLAANEELYFGEIDSTPWLLISAHNLLKEVFLTLSRKPDAILANENSGM